MKTKLNNFVSCQKFDSNKRHKDFQSFALPLSYSSIEMKTDVLNLFFAAKKDKKLICIFDFVKKHRESKILLCFKRKEKKGFLSSGQFFPLWFRKSLWLFFLKVFALVFIFDVQKSVQRKIRTFIPDLEDRCSTLELFARLHAFFIFCSEKKISSPISIFCSLLVFLKAFRFWPFLYIFCIYSS